MGSDACCANIPESRVAALEMEGQESVVDAEQIKDFRMHVAHRLPVLHGVPAYIVRVASLAPPFAGPPAICTDNSLERRIRAPV